MRSNVTGDEAEADAGSVKWVSRRADQSLELAIAGQLDMAAALKLEPQLDRLLDAPGVRRLECDLAGVSFVDSAGLGLLLALRERARDRGIAMTLVSVSAPVRRVLDFSGLEAVLTDDRSGHAPR